MSELSGTSEDSLGWVYPAQPAIGPPAPPEFIEQSLSGIMPLISGQSYIDVTFPQSQSSSHWIFLDCRVVNTSDPTPLNIWAGIVNVKTRTGFRAQLNGMPDSANYQLHWSIIEAPPVSPDATTYYFTGASSGVIGVAATFAVSLPINTFLEDPVTVTPDDSGGGGTFAPVSVELSEEDTVVTFTYTPASYGLKTLNVSNSGTLTDPDSRTFTPASDHYTLIGPSSGSVGAPSTNFTAALPVGGVLLATVTVTPADGGGGGTFTPTTVVLSSFVSSVTFTYTPASTGAKTISVTNDGGLTNPANLTYTVTELLVSSWADSSGNGHTATMTGTNRPTLKTNIVNGLPVVRFTVAGVSKLDITPISGVSPFTVFAVFKQAGLGMKINVLRGNGTAALPFLLQESSDNNVYFGDRTAYTSLGVGSGGPGPPSVGFHVLTAISTTAPLTALRIDGTGYVTTATALANSGNFATIGYDSVTPGYSDGDIADIILYNVTPSTPDVQGIEKYLGTKYGITVAGGTSVDPLTVAGLVAWWKADSGVT